MEIKNGWVTIDKAVEESGYCAEYIRRLARLGKIDALKIGKVWIVNLDDLKKHKIVEILKIHVIEHEKRSKV